MRIECAGEASLIVYFDQGELRLANQNVMALTAYLDQSRPVWLLDLVPSYRSLLVCFDPYQTDFLAVRRLLKHWQGEPSESAHSAGSLIELPVLYGFPKANDLARIAEHNKLTIRQVIDRHLAMDYQVFALGFAPGFAFLGELDPKIAAPRLATPRNRVPQGAVAIADRQTAVYPSVSPGGWNIIGLCPSSLFQPDRQPASLLKVGDRVRFKEIDQQRFLQLGGRLE